MNYGFLNHRPEGNENLHRTVVVDALQIAQLQQVKLFRTFIPETGKMKDELDFTIVTTNKETHLGLGRFENLSVLRHFCLLLEQMFDNNRHVELLLYKETDQKEGWYITRTQVKHSVTYHFAPAN
jgi:type IV secretory pathway VirD2 relaxase